MERRWSPGQVAAAVDKTRRVRIVCPPEETFEDVRRNIRCTVEHCDKILPNSSCLRVHLKTHGIKRKNGEDGGRENSEESADYPTEYHCPLASCVYSVTSLRHFSSMKLLKQHYSKVHAEKKYKCAKCGAGYGLNRDKARHESTCGVIYKCGTCQCPYTTREAMMTHCHRKSHALPSELIIVRQQRASQQKSKKKVKGCVCQNETPDLIVKNNHPPPKVILVNIQPAPPKLQQSKVTHHKPILCRPTPNLNVIPLTTVTVTPKNVKVSQENLPAKQSVTIQTDSHPRESTGDKVLSGNDGTQSCRTQTRDLQTSTAVMETGIQTNVTIPLRKRLNQPQTAAQTQTHGDYILQAAMATANIPIRKSSVGTQMTPRLKAKGLKRGNMCSSETQTVTDQATSKKRRRRRGSTLGPPLKMDSMCQTSARQAQPLVTMTADSMCQVDSVGRTSTCAQTNVMVDSISQTLAVPTVNDGNNVLTSATSRSASDPHQSQSRISFIPPRPGMSVTWVKDGVGRRRVSRIKRSGNRNQQCRDTSSKTRRTNVGDADIHPVINSMGNAAHAATVSTETNVTNLLSHRLDSTLNTNNHASQGTSTDFDLDNEFQRFLLATCRGDSANVHSLLQFDQRNTCDPLLDESRSASVGGEHSTERSSVLCSTNSTTVSSTPIMGNPFGSTQTNGEQFRGTMSSVLSSRGFVSLTDHQTGNLTHSFVNTGQLSGNLSSGFVSTNYQGTGNSPRTLSGFVSLTDSQVQTLSTDDLDALIQSAQQSTNTTETLNDMHTQTINDFDVFDLLMNNMQTQTTDELDLDNFNFTDIQTQTMFDFHSADDFAAMTVEDTQSSSTQTSVDVMGGMLNALQQSEGTQTPQFDGACLTDTQTQTPLQGLFSFSNSHTQTTFHDLNNIFAEFE